MSTWGDSWGNSWGDSWSAVVVAAPAVEESGGAYGYIPLPARAQIQTLKFDLRLRPVSAFSRAVATLERMALSSGLGRVEPRVRAVAVLEILSLASTIKPSHATAKAHVLLSNLPCLKTSLEPMRGGDLETEKMRLAFYLLEH